MTAGSSTLFEQIADYILKPPTFSEEAYYTANLCLADAIGCAILATNYPACTKLLGPLVPGTIVPGGARVPGTDFILDPVRAAFNIGSMIRWLDFNDTWLAAEWGHPSDNIGGLLAIADYLSQKKAMPIKNLLEAMIMAYEIQGILSLENSFNRVGFDHVIFVKAATAAVATSLLGGTKAQMIDALSQAFVDVGPLRIYRHGPHTGSRKSWAAGDATSRGLQFAWMTLQGELGYPSTLSAERWGLEEVLFNKKKMTLGRPLGCYVMENILFKISYPAEFHAQTAVEAAVQLHPKVLNQWDNIRSIEILTQAPALRIIDKQEALNNPADRDHCLQYMVAIALLNGDLTAADYEDEAAQDPRIDALREKMRVTEKEEFSKHYLHPSLRSIGNAITITLNDGTLIGPVSIEYPIGHRKRRVEALPLLYEKLYNNLRSRWNIRKIERFLSLIKDEELFHNIAVHDWVSKVLS